MPEMWMVRAGRNAFLVQEFIKNNYVAVGWEDLKDLSKIENKNNLKQLYEKSFPDAKLGERRSGLSQITKFVFEFDVGDAVATYDPELRNYHIGTITSGYKYDPKAAGEFCHTRKVEWKHVADRDKLKVSTKNTLGAISTIFSIPKEAQDDLLQVASGKAPERESALSASEDDQEIKEIREDIKSQAFEFTKDKIQKLDWDEMQDLVAGILQGMGYKTRVAAPGPDRGTDIIASPDGLGLEQPRIRAQVKHKAGSIGASELRSFLGGLRANDRGLYVSTGGFSREARYEAERSTIPVTLIDIDELASLLIDNYDKLDMNTRSLIPLVKIYWPAE